MKGEVEKRREDMDREEEQKREHLKVEKEKM